MFNSSYVRYGRTLHYVRVVYVLPDRSNMTVECCEYGIYTIFCFQAEDGIRDLVRSRGLGDVYKRQMLQHLFLMETMEMVLEFFRMVIM